jgi:uracil-DNA glycosylase
MTMTREDALRELELLPVWQLRAPVMTQDLVQNVTEDSAPATEKVLPESVPTIAQSLAQKTAVEFDIYQSENKAWVFICPESPIDTALQSMLFDNILIALQIKAKKMAINLADLQSQDSQLQVSAKVQNQAKVIVAMGEKTAQILLNSENTIEDLRANQLNGNWHILHNLPLIVTYSAAELLEHLPNKAKTWDDLCIALRLVNA